MTSTEMKESPTHLGREQEWSRLSAPEQLTSPLLMDHDLSDVASSELPQFPVRDLCLSLPLSMDRDLRDTASSELPQAPMGCICVFRSMTSTEMKESPTHLGREQEWSRLSAPEQLTSPLLMDHDLSDVASSELPQFPVRDLCVGNYSQITNRRCRRNDHLISDGMHLCGELQPDQKEPIQGRREFEPSRLSAPEQLAPPFLVHHDPSDGASSELPQVSVDDVDGNERITDPFRSRTRMVSIKRPRTANFTAVDGS
ncbi:hypothetical protein Cantr_04711 [Candida viswanathii]|nr:hypothetical protein Cantr_04711 [Candida viswanathii]